MPNNNVLKLVLDGVLQSYGTESKWDTRDTGYYPTKSAIIGMIGCAMGIERDDTYLDILSKNISINVRIDKPGRPLDDLQTVNYPVLQANGSLKKNKKKDLFYPLLNKFYLQDAVFTVFVVGSLELLNSIYDAFQRPFWPVYLGRKCCIPSRPICIERPFENVENIEDFIQKSPIICVDRLIKKDIQEVIFQYIIEDISGNIFTFDNPDSRGQKYYKGRYIKKGTFMKKVKKVGDNYVLE